MRPFDRRADGLLAGEGGGAVILKRLDDALRDGNAIYAVVKGVGSASDGREVDVLAPSSSGQVLALENAYADAGIERDSIGYLELHGTGTVVGDLTELATIKTFFGTVHEPATARAMGSVKSMIGHCMPAAGIAAFIKTTLALSNKILPPSLHCEEPRPELADAPFYLNAQTRPWVHNAAHGPRRAGVNAFGFGGINAHVVLEEAAASHNPAANAAGSPSSRRTGSVSCRVGEPAALAAGWIARSRPSKSVCGERANCWRSRQNRKPNCANNCFASIASSIAMKPIPPWRIWPGRCRAPWRHRIPSSWLSSAMISPTCGSCCSVASPMNQKTRMKFTTPPMRILLAARSPFSFPAWASPA